MIQKSIKYFGFDLCVPEFPMFINDFFRCHSHALTAMKGTCTYLTFGGGSKVNSANSLCSLKESMSDQ